MNLEDAISAHVRWKMRLVTYLARPDGSLQPEEVASPGKCELGRWLQATALAPNPPAQLPAILAEHQRFHRAASQVVAVALKGKRQEATHLLEAGGEFAQASVNLVVMLRKLRDAPKA